ncbi:MAG: excinuclease ABC subunit UvrC [Patescibacteria group bacterium]|jgi:excinuclease ABC subunit C
MSPALKRQLQVLPAKPGVYTFSDEKGEILYVGKATSLKSRVGSYFSKKSSLSQAKRIMVSKIAKLDTIVTSSELEALMLETTRIKQLHPPYNIVMRDDKNFLHIKIALAEQFPSVTTVRRLSKDGSRYYGPYMSAGAVYETLKLLKKVFPYKNCTNSPEKPCFEFHLHRCLGHGTNEASKARYREVIQQLMRFLGGQTKEIEKQLQSQMTKASAAKQFERAALARDRLRAIHKIMERQHAILLSRENVDVIGYAAEGGLAATNRLIIRNGKMIDKQVVLLQHVLDETPENVLASFLEQFYTQVTDPPARLALPFPLKLSKAFHNVTSAEPFIPQRGRVKKLLAVSNLNAQEFLRQQKASFERDDTRLLKGLRELTKALDLPEIPHRIEAYDIANVQGEHAVGGMVVFVDGRPEKKAYRRFTIKTVQGSNDPAMLAEVLQRRFGHAEAISSTAVSHKQDTFNVRPTAAWPTADLLILDGGAGQLSVARKVIPKDVTVPIVALAKGGHAREPQQGEREKIFRPDAPTIRLQNPSDGLFLIERIRDEAHRFTIAGYRGKHRKASIQSALDTIPGIGPVMKKKLLQTFGSVAGVRRATDEELRQAVGPALFKVIREKL